MLKCIKILLLNSKQVILRVQLKEFNDQKAKRNYVCTIIDHFNHERYHKNKKHKKIKK